MAWILDKAKETSPEAVEKWRIMLNLEEGRESAPAGDVVCSHRVGVNLHRAGEYINSSRYLANENRLKRKFS